MVEGFLIGIEKQVPIRRSVNAHKIVKVAHKIAKVAHKIVKVAHKIAKVAHKSRESRS